MVWVEMKEETLGYCILHLVKVSLTGLGRTGDNLTLDSPWTSDNVKFRKKIRICTRQKSTVPNIKEKGKEIVKCIQNLLLCETPS